MLRNRFIAPFLVLFAVLVAALGLLRTALTPDDASSGRGRASGKSPTSVATQPVACAGPEVTERPE